MNHTKLLLFIIFISQNTVSAQRMEVLIRSKIEVKGNVYDFYESEEFFKDVPLAYQTYQKAQKAKKAGKVLGYASLGSLGHWRHTHIRKS